MWHSIDVLRVRDDPFAITSSQAIMAVHGEGGDSASEWSSNVKKRVAFDTVATASTLHEQKLWPRMQPFIGFVPRANSVDTV